MRIQPSIAAPPRRVTSVVVALLCAVLAIPVAGASVAWAPVLQAPIDLLGITAGDSNRRLPERWRARAVRGERAPRSQVIDSAGIAFLRIEGTASAGWFVRQVEPAIAPSDGMLAWTWRAPVSSPATDLRAAATDDAPLRVFVAFGPLRTFGRQPRTIFYSMGGAEPADYRRSGHGSQRVFVVRVGGAERSRDWQRVVVDPFDDYRAAWGEEPPPIAVLGLLQDTDQTRTRAVADLQTLRWIPADVPNR